MKTFTHAPELKPRISVNKLGEYLTANAVRRRAIIKDQKEPSSAVVPRYQRVFPILEKYFTTGNDSMISDGIDRLRAKRPETDWQADDNLNTALALEVFATFCDDLDLSGCCITRADPHEKAKLAIGGVDVSVRPDFYLRFEKRKQPFIGALKFHWTKDDGHQLGQDGGICVATTLHQFLEQYHKDDANPSLDHCLSIDVFRKSVVSAPKGYLRVRNNIAAGCEEIALRWKAS